MRKILSLKRYLILVLVPLVIGITILILLGFPPTSFASSDLKRAARFTLHYDYPWVRPNVEWQVATPASEGMDQSKLDRLRDDLAARNTKAFLVVKGGNIAYEWYAPGSNPNRAFSAASLAKAIVGSTALMLALDSGQIHLDDYVTQYVPEWRYDPTKADITIRHLATHSAGIEDVNFAQGARGELEGWKQEYVDNSTRRFTMAQTLPDVTFAPGSEYSYSGTGYYVLAYAITASLQGSPTPDVRTLLEQRLNRPMGVPDDAWIIGYGKKTRLDDMDLYAIGSGANYTPRAMARVGSLMLNRGSWEGQQIVSPESVDSILSKDNSPPPNLYSDDPEPQTALGWWTNKDGFWPSLPEDAFVGAGANHQVLLVVPSLDLVMVRVGGSLTGNHWGNDFWDELEQYMFAPLMDSIVPTN